MANIVFIPYPEAGHYMPTFKIARALAGGNHQVCYCGIPDYQELVGFQGFRFLPILERLCPKGFIAAQAVENRVENLKAVLDYAKLKDQGKLFDIVSDIRRVISAARPDLFVIDNLLPELALIAHRSGVKSLLLNTQLFNLWEAGETKTPLFAPLMQMTELVLCPKEFDFPRAQRRKACHYVEASIDLERKEPDFPWQRLDPSKRLIFCSLGTVSHLLEGGKEFLGRIIEAVGRRSEWQMVMATGSHLEGQQLGRPPANVLLVNTAPQLKLLARASLMINHAGFNSVKECIFFGVPMNVYPMTGNTDTPAVAARVVYHGLGVKGNYQKASVEQIGGAIERVLGERSYKQRVEQMGERFRVAEARADSLSLIQAALTGVDLDKQATSRMS